MKPAFLVCSSMDVCRVPHAQDVGIQSDRTSESQPNVQLGNELLEPPAYSLDAIHLAGPVKVPTTHGAWRPTVCGMRVIVVTCIVSCCAFQVLWAGFVTTVLASGSGIKSSCLSYLSTSNGEANSVDKAFSSDRSAGLVRADAWYGKRAKFALAEASITRCGPSWRQANIECGSTCISDADCAGDNRCFTDLSTAPCSIDSNSDSLRNGTRCGPSWRQANIECGSTCISDADCAGDNRCFTDLSTAPCSINSNSDSLRNGTRCGPSWRQANIECGSICISDADCAGDNRCFTDLSTAPCSIDSNSDSLRNGTRCGLSWRQANIECGSTCISDADCAGDNRCFTDLSTAPCSIDSNSDSLRNGTRCGLSWRQANIECGSTCISDADCAGDNRCFTDLSTAPCSIDSNSNSLRNGTRCGPSWRQANIECGSTCISDADCAGDNRCFTDLSTRPCARGLAEGVPERQECGLGVTCPLKACCSQWGYCGWTEQFCSAGCQSDCGIHVDNPDACDVSRPSVRWAYYASWAVNRKCAQVLPRDLDPDAYTHLAFAFAHVSEDHRLIPSAPSDVPMYSQFTALKQRNPSLKTVIAVGGWAFNDRPTQHRFSQTAATASSRATFVESVIVFLSQHSFDGLDLDWEYPGAEDRGGAPADVQNYVHLVRELREAFGARYGLTMAVPLSHWYLRHFDVARLSEHVDLFNVMSYDIHGTWDRNYPSMGPFVRSHTNLTAIKQGVKMFWKNGVGSHQLVLGLAAYGRSFTLQSASCAIPGVCEFTEGGAKGPCTDAVGVLSNLEIEALREGGATTVYDEASASMYTVQGDQWVGYDNPGTIALKKQFAEARCFRGTALWSIDMDVPTPAGDCDCSSAPDNRTAGLSTHRVCADVCGVYLVRRGDDLQSVAAHLSTPAADILQANGLHGSGTPIVPGQLLLIPPCECMFPLAAVLPVLSAVRCGSAVHRLVAAAANLGKALTVQDPTARSDAFGGAVGFAKAVGACDLVAGLENEVEEDVDTVRDKLRNGTINAVFATVEAVKNSLRDASVPTSYRHALAIARDRQAALDILVGHHRALVPIFDVLDQSFDSFEFARIFPQYLYLASVHKAVYQEIIKLSLCKADWHHYQRGLLDGKYAGLRVAVEKCVRQATQEGRTTESAPEAAGAQPPSRSQTHHATCADLMADFRLARFEDAFRAGQHLAPPADLQDGPCGL